LVLITRAYGVTAMSAHFAFVTLLTSDSYLPGVLAISGALKDLHQVEPQSQVTYDTVCLVTPETLDVSTIKLLRKAYDIVIGVEVIDQSDPAGLSLLGELLLRCLLLLNVSAEGTEKFSVGVSFTAPRPFQVSCPGCGA
jgi:hypothetical protein